MPFKFRTKVVRTRERDGTVKTVDALRGEPADPKEIEDVKSHFGESGILGSPA